MRNVRMTIWVMVLVFYLIPPKAADGNYYDGQTHNITVKYNFGIVIGNSHEGEATTVNILEGGWVPNYTVTEDSYINIFSGGYVMSPNGSYGGISDSYDNTEVTLQGGIIDGSLRAWDNANISISSGTITSWIRAYNDSTIDISGGNIGDNLHAYENSVLAITGGLIGGDLDVFDYSIVTIEGTGFNYPYGAITNPIGTLTGTLSNGDPINSLFYIHDNASIVLVPEPSVVPAPSALLLSTIGVGCVSWYRRRRC